MPTALTHQALYRACMREAAAQSRQLVQRIVWRAAQEMPQRAAESTDVVERHLLAEAGKLLAQHQGYLCEAYPQALLQAFAQALAQEHREGAGSATAPPAGDADESAEVVRAREAVLGAVAPQLAQLDALMSQLQGLDAVQPQRNPLRPDVYVKALRTVTQQSPVAASARRRWLQHLGEALGPELADSYDELAGMLRTRGIGL